ncbi:ACT domain-containing protein ACR3 isoform X1 [Amborella trichopoda]|nr:ACT domain-containing protein ACR3 isoform X1 [Amborella trichopoda]XP_020524487.1 ACT domain-containing protein ACR3 isoform X1 [Amborella trichopoda]|eukprot:XP_006847223.2 ACT domain-containing protein ACR3 isoform X1 [Amborella trichopoda]
MHMAKSHWPYFDPEYENLSQRINPPRVSFDNTTCSDCTLVKVDSANKPGILLEVVQVLTDMDLIISKAYISSDGGWFMDVFHVTNQMGQKLTDTKTMEYIEKALGARGTTCATEVRTWPGKQAGVAESIDGGPTAIELVGSDRPGLLSEISAILASLDCNVVAAEVWTHRTRIACVVYVTDSTTSRPLDDPARLAAVEEQLRNVLKGRDGDRRSARTNFSLGFMHTDRRLHQMMFADRDYEEEGEEEEAPLVSVDTCGERGYSVVNVRCKDRPKLLFDTVCTLTDMHYVVFHASIVSQGPHALQEYYIRHKDGCILDGDSEKQRVIKCLEAAIQRRVSNGLTLEMCASDRVGLLSDVTRVFRENGLSVTRAGVTTIGGKAMNVFYVRYASTGEPVDTKTIEALRREIGNAMLLNVKNLPASAKPSDSNADAKFRFSFGSFFERFLA